MIPTIPITRGLLRNIHELKMLELERKQQEFARIREIVEEKLKGIMSLESLKTEAEGELDEAIKTATLTDLEARIAEELEGEILHGKSTSVLEPSGDILKEPSGLTAHIYDFQTSSSQPEHRVNPPS